jgi:hypothetical protein
MWSDLLLGIAWIAIILIPAIVAYRQPVVSHNGYLENYMDPSKNGTSGAEHASDSGKGE